MRKKDSTDNFLVHTDAQGSYTFTLLPGGVYRLQATKDGYAAAEVSAVFLRPRESKIIDLTLAPLGQGSATSAPQFFDQPQFTVAGVTDTTTLGGHGSDTIARTQNSLAKDTVSLAETAAKPSPDAAREKSLRELAKRQPDDFGVNHQLGQLLIAGGRAHEAIPFLERAAVHRPGELRERIRCRAGKRRSRQIRYRPRRSNEAAGNPRSGGTASSPRRCR